MNLETGRIVHLHTVDLYGAGADEAEIQGNGRHKGPPRESGSAVNNQRRVEEIKKPRLSIALRELVVRGGVALSRITTVSSTRRRILHGPVAPRTRERSPTPAQ